MTAWTFRTEPVATFDNRTATRRSPRYRCRRSRPSFREALAAACGEDVAACDLDAMAQLSPQDFDARAGVVVATIQSFRVEEIERGQVGRLRAERSGARAVQERCSRRCSSRKVA